MASVNPIPKNHHSVTPYVIVKDGKRALDFYKQAFGAVLAMEPLMRPDGRVGHAELKIGDSVIMLADEFQEMDARGPQSLGGSPVSLYLYVRDVDNVCAQALKAGAHTMHPVKDQFYGDRMGTLKDPFGHIWHIATHVEDVPAAELKRRASEAMKIHQGEHAAQHGRGATA